MGILLGGWVFGSRVTERKKLDLPLWRALTAAQTRELARFREFKRTGRVLEPEDGPAAGSADGPRAADRSSLSRKDRARMADVERRRAARHRHAPKSTRGPDASAGSAGSEGSDDPDGPAGPDRGRKRHQRQRRGRR